MPRGQSRGIWLIAVAAVFGVLVAPSGTCAKPGYISIPAEHQRQLEVRGTNGFRIAVERIDGRVELTASNRATSAIYIVHSPPTRDNRIEATFPGLGEVSVRFQGSEPARRSSSFCEDHPSLMQKGTYRGVIRFRGEQGFTRVVARHARGFVYRSFKESCKGVPSRPIRAHLLTASTKSQTGITGFVASKPANASAIFNSAEYFASQTQRGHGMLSLKLAAAQGERDTFAISGPPGRPESATVAPPAPFSGTASFHATPGAPAEWEGNLAVELPGIGAVPLAGPSFSSELCIGRHCVGASGG